MCKIESLKPGEASSWLQLGLNGLEMVPSGRRWVASELIEGFNGLEVPGQA
jgi:hypothetical protein